jgi:homogentisate 1,2-dioxygenase
MKRETPRQHFLPEYGTEVLHELFKKAGFNTIRFNSNRMPAWNHSEYTFRIPIKANNCMIEKITFNQPDYFGGKKAEKITIKTKDGYYQYIKL